MNSVFTGMAVGVSVIGSGQFVNVFGCVLLVFIVGVNAANQESAYAVVFDNADPDDC